MTSDVSVHGSLNLSEFVVTHGVSLLQTKLRHREGHAARRLGLEVMPRDQPLQRGLRLDCRLLHGQDKICARAHVSHVEERGVASLFQLPGEPRCPGAVGMSIADEKVDHR
jgi:hypothetical protein